MAINLKGMFPDLERIAVDPASCFINGNKATSLFSGGDITIGRWETNPLYEPWPAMPDPGALAAKVGAAVMTDVTSFAASYLGMKLGQLLSPPSLADVISRASSYMGKYVKTPGELLIEATVDREDRTDIEDNAEMLERIAEVTEHINSYVGKIKKHVDKVKGFVQDQCGYILPFISQGPDWVEAQAQAIDDRACKEIEKFVHQNTKELFDKKESFIDGLAEGYAEKMAEKINELERDIIYKALKDVIMFIKQAENKAKAAIKKAILDLAARLGL